MTGNCKALLIQSAGEEWLRRFIEGKENRRPSVAILDMVLSQARAALKEQELRLLLSFLSLFPEISESTVFEWLNQDKYLWWPGDDKRLGEFLLSREWRETTRRLNWNWKSELKSAAWHARELLHPWGIILFSQPDTSRVPFLPNSTTNTIKSNVSMTTSSTTPQTILFLSANPTDSQPLRLDQELRDIGEGLQRSQQRDQFQLQQRMAARPRDIQRAMLDLNPQMIHFSGHGAGTEGLAFEDESGKTQFVSGEALADLFSLFADQLRCVVLNGCYTEVQAKAIAQHIPYVIGMNKAIGDKAAIAFAVGFYDALGAGRDVEFAFKLGCLAIRLEGIEEHLTPVLIEKPTESTSQNPPHPPAASGISQQPVTIPDSITPIEIFISYSHRDDELKDTLITHFSNLKRQKKIAAWQDRAIEGGQEWEAQIKQQLESAQIILLLISPDFMASDYCYDIEMERAIKRHDAGAARVIPVILRPCDWKDSPFSKLQALPKDAKAVTQWSNRDSAFLDVVQGIRRAVDSLTKK